MAAPHAAVVIGDSDEVVDSLPVTRLDHVRRHVKVLHDKLKCIFLQQYENLKSGANGFFRGGGRRRGALNSFI